MKKRLFCFIVSGLFCFAQAVNAPGSFFAVAIEQDGKMVHIQNHIAQLKKAPFKVVITLKGIDGVYMSASFQPTLYNLAATDSIPDYAEMSAMVRAESNFNEDKELFVESSGFSYLFYDSTMNWHRFDKKIKVEGAHVIGSKTVKSIIAPDSKTSYAISKIKDDVYLFFVATERVPYGQIPKELERYKLKLTWL